MFPCKSDVCVYPTGHSGDPSMFPCESDVYPTGHSGSTMLQCESDVYPTGHSGDTSMFQCELNVYPT